MNVMENERRRNGNDSLLSNVTCRLSGSVHPLHSSGKERVERLAAEKSRLTEPHTATHYNYLHRLLLIDCF